MVGATRPSIVVVWLSTALLLSGCSTAPPAPSTKAATTASSGVTYHSVRKGETLYSIAWRYGVDYRMVAYWNGVGEPFTIYPGQRLRLLVTGVRTPSRAADRPSAGVSAANVSRSADHSKRTARETIKDPEAAKAPSSNASATRKAPVSSSKEQRRVARWIWPVRGKVITHFGQSGQKGIDIGGRAGEPVQATAGGRVVYSGGGLIGYGKLIIVKHNKRYLSAYAHNDDVFVKEGDQVRIGQRISTMGSTGTDRVKLHFEIRRDGKPVNPLRYLPK